MIANLARNWKWGHYWRAGWWSSDEIRDLSPVCDQSVSPLSVTRYKNILNAEGTRVCSQRRGQVRRTPGDPPVLNCCMCVSLSFTCCDTKPPGAICSCCFITHSNQQGHKDPANKGSRNRLLRQSCHVGAERPPSRGLFLFSWSHAEIRRYTNSKTFQERCLCEDICPVNTKLHPKTC